MITIKSYFIPQKIYATFTGISNICDVQEKTVYSTPLKIYSGVNNPIKIRCLNSDQQTINISNVNIQLGVFEPSSENELITQEAIHIDDNYGIAEIILTPAELAPLDFGFYEIALTAYDTGGNVWPIFINDNSGSRLTAQLMKGPILAYTDPIPVTFLDLVDVGVVSNDINLMNRPQNSTTATLEANLINYTGNIIFQGTMVSTPTSIDWGNVSSAFYSNTSGPVLQTVSGAFAWIRVVLDSADPTGNGLVTPSNFISSANIKI
jgi:hypothetical protein